MTTRIDVCHGPTSGPAGARRITKRLEEVYGAEAIHKRGCCGRCKFNNSIVVDGQIVSNLNPDTIDEQFLADPARALKDAREFEKRTLSELNDVLDSNDLFLD